MAEETVALRYDGPAARFRFADADIECRSGETVTVDADATVLTDTDAADDEPTEESLADYLVALGFERVDRGYRALLDESIPDIESALATGEHDAHLDALAHAEREGENRTGALEAIRHRQEEVSE